jgi:hypothetical protein
MAFQDAWDEVFLLSIEKSGGSAVQFAAIIDPASFEVSEGEYPSESMPNAAGGRIWKQDPQADGEISFDIIPIELDTTSGVGLFQQYVGPNPADAAFDTSNPLETGGTEGATEYAYIAGVSRVRDLFRVVVLWTNDVAATTAEGAVASGKEALRFFASDCRFVNQEHSFSDGILKTTVTFKFKPFNKAGTAKLAGWQSCDSSAALVALDSY